MGCKCISRTQSFVGLKGLERQVGVPCPSLRNPRHSENAGHSWREKQPRRLDHRHMAQNRGVGALGCN